MKTILFFGRFIFALLPSLMLAQNRLQVSAGNGLQLTSSGPLQLVFNNCDFLNNGKFTSLKGSTTTFTCDQTRGNSAIGGNGLTIFNNLIAGTKYGDLRLDNNISVFGNLVMQSGNLQMNNHILDLGSTGFITGERNDSRITGLNYGLVTVTAVLNAPNSVNPGNIGVEITSQANLGTTVISRGHQPQMNDQGDVSIDRYFNIVPEHNSGLNASLRFHYLEAEVGTSNKNVLSFFSKKNKWDPWSGSGKDASDPNANWVVKGNLDQLDNYTLARKLSSFSGNLKIKNGLQVFPNPYIDHFSLILTSEAEKDDTIILYDLNGHLLQSKKVHLLKGYNTVEWIEGKYAAGTYYLSFANEQGKVVKIVKL